jgi:hypothetical protein
MDRNDLWPPLTARDTFANWHSVAVVVAVVAHVSAEQLGAASAGEEQRVDHGGPAEGVGLGGVEDALQLIGGEPDGLGLVGDPWVGARWRWGSRPVRQARRCSGRTRPAPRARGPWSLPATAGRCAEGVSSRCRFHRATRGRQVLRWTLRRMREAPRSRRRRSPGGKTPSGLAATSMRTELVLAALEQAIWTRGREGLADLSGLVCHRVAEVGQRGEHSVVVDGRWSMVDGEVEVPVNRPGLGGGSTPVPVLGG